MKRTVLLSVTCALFSGASASAQNNPDISIIPRFLVETDDGGELPAVREFRTPELRLDEFEIAIQGYLNPYARADVFLAKGSDEEEPIEIEEAYATFVRGLPLDLNVRMGKYLPEFGKLNLQHPHQWSFTTRPLSVERFLGEEGLNDLGVSVSVLLPTGDIYTRLSADLLRGGSLRGLDPASGEAFGGAGLADTAGGETPYAVSGRLMAFFPVGTYADLEIGLSGLSGVHDPYRSLRFFYGNLDFKYKWKPDLYTSLTLQGEALINARSVAAGSMAGGPAADEDVRSFGAFLFADYQFRKVWSVGARVDYAESPYDATDRARALSVYAGFYPVEESTAFRFHLQRTMYESAGTTTTVHAVMFQFIFSLGPHKAHPF